ncbi:hypothetical protein [Sutcliffiella rhizosphaerae]|uniref:ABC transporter periplasmic binding protein yphF n=1 Tax=Sutcliffiella rhizosphaerae TaxID=2880967 RepID=A0ABM8YUE9_9BACI|nr:hypothetical protein [Sutcliffiella rhizosphaerae]CAG9623604.1 hypothetical protein BACCIP111883_04422 [Sutcliffiella rhizosphaerae]
MKWNRFLLLVGMLVLSIILSGCLYPEDRMTQNQVPYLDQLESVQSSVNQYREASGGLLPIKERDMETPIYQKYPIDFNKLSPRYIQDPPGTAYESGGVYLYVLVDVENDPKVKLIDLRMAEEIRNINMRIDLYKRSNNGYPPVKEVINNQAFKIDWDKLGFESEPFIQSPISGKNLPIILNKSGEAQIDYSIDLYELLQKHEHQYSSDDDIRDIIVEHSVFVPAFSLPYTLDENNEPVIKNIE